MKIESQDFMEWLHREREKMEEERSKSGFTLSEWVDHELKKVQARDLLIKEREEKYEEH